jgi:hypothetical protein
LKYQDTHQYQHHGKEQRDQRIHVFSTSKVLPCIAKIVPNWFDLSYGPGACLIGPNLVERILGRAKAQDIRRKMHDSAA